MKKYLVLPLLVFCLGFLADPNSGGIKGSLTSRGKTLSFEPGSQEIICNFPCGSDGPLFVAAGDTLLLPGGIHDYSSVNIQGTLMLAGPLTAIGSLGTFNLSGIINHAPNTAIDSESLSTADGHTLSLDFTPRSGGAGALSVALGTAAGAQNSGNGGGGATQLNGGNATALVAGNGANGLSDGVAQGGALGGQTSGETGGTGSDQTSTLLNNAVGGGGGGGHRGNAGIGLYIKAVGNITGSGFIDLTADNGGDGGEGGNATALSGNAYGGGGGGAGSGGNGGKLDVLYHGVSTQAWTVTTTRGLGGTRGFGGASSSTFGSATDGLNGAGGQSGNAGSSSIASY